MGLEAAARGDQHGVVLWDAGPALCTAHVCIRWGCLRQAAAAEGCISAGIFIFFPFLKAVSSLKAVFCTSTSEKSGENLGRVLLAGELQLLLCVLAAGAAEIV